jgi:site-specific DNA-methyltransferase (adenine-specific)
MNVTITADTIHRGDAAELLATMSDRSADLTVTSPPYDGIREYHGYVFDFPAIARELYRVTADGGVVVWVVGDQLVKGSESGTSFRQALGFLEVGFRLHDTMIYAKQNPMPRKQRRYTQQFEYMLVLSKGEPKTFNPITEPCRYAGCKSTGTYFETPGTDAPYRGSDRGGKRIADTKVKGNVWTYWVGRSTHAEKQGEFKAQHPAVMPLSLARDHVLSWSNPGDLVLDPMCGSGTTLVAARRTGRRYLGFDISDEYVGLARDRLAREATNTDIAPPGRVSGSPDISTPELPVLAA